MFSIKNSHWCSRLRCIGSLTLCVLLAASLGGCNLFKDDDGEGSVSFTLETSDSPMKPNIGVPENTKRFLMELIDETGNASQADGSSDSDVSSEEDSGSETDGSSDSAARSLRAADSAANAEGAAEDAISTEADGGSDAEEEEESGESSSDGDASEESSSADGASSLSCETTCSIIPASYSISKNYTAGEEVSLTIDKVSSGSWIVRVSALDADGVVLGHVQKAVTVGDGADVSVSGWLNPGPAPEGYLFMADPGANTVTRLSLMSEELQPLYISGHYPAVLFFKEGFDAGKGSLLHALTGAKDLLDITVGISGTDCDAVEQYIPANNGLVAPGEFAVISYFRENGVRFYNYDDHSYSDLVYTGTGAGEFSNVVNGYTWVTNENSGDLTKIDIANQKTAGENISTGDTVKKLWLNDTGSRLWTICQKPKPCVRVIDSEGNNLDDYTEQIVNPSAIRIVGDVVCVGEGSRNEVVFFTEAAKCEEIERIKINEGVGDVFFSDGYRLYVLTNQSSLAVVDLQTRSYNRIIKIKGNCSSIVWMH